MNEGKPTVLVVEDNDMLRKLLVAELAEDGAIVEQARTGSEGLEKAASPLCTVIVLDLMLPDIDGLEFIERLRALRSDPPSVIAITGVSPTVMPDAVIEEPYRGLVSAVFRKPFDHKKLRETVAFCAR